MILQYSSVACNMHLSFSNFCLNCYCFSVECRPGYEDVGGQCQQCARGFFKEINAAASCRQCPTGFTTADIGSTLETMCNIRKHF